MYLESVFRKVFCRYPLDVKLCQMKKIHLENAFGNCFWGYPLALDVKLYQMKIHSSLAEQEIWKRLQYQKQPKETTEFQSVEETLLSLTIQLNKARYSYSY